MKLPLIGQSATSAAAVERKPIGAFCGGQLRSCRMVEKTADDTGLLVGVKRR
jgi:hypothetical protein